MDISGEKYGKLLVIRKGEDYISKKGRRCTTWVCTCECGVTSQIRQDSLRSGLSTSCGCVQKERFHSRTHGMSKTPTYNSWLAMRQRCYYEKADFYPSYGGRGITVCTRWKDSFENFLEDMGEKPLGYSIERVDVGGGYCKDNCVWLDSKLQARNTRTQLKDTCGVGYRDDFNRWYAAIGVDNKQVWLGLFKSKAEAIEARKSAEQEYW